LISDRRPQHPLAARSRRRSGQKERVCRITSHSQSLRRGLTILYTVKDKANHAVVLDKATSDKLNKDVQSYRLVTVAVLVDRLKINGSLARAALKDLEEKGTITKVVGHSKGSIYTRAAAGSD
jgi:small subunit ribosomal protein S25e